MSWRVYLELLTAHLTSSDEGIFGEEFFEPIFKLVTNCVIAGAKGVDFVIEAAVNRFVRDFARDFCDERGNVLWEKLVQFNSGK